METYVLTRTGQTPLRFKGEKIACVYGQWANGVLWRQYHNLIVYRTEDNRYVLAIQSGCATIHEIEQPHDHAVIVADTNSLSEELRRYDPLSYRLHRPRDGQDDNYIRRRYQENVKELLNLVRRVEGGEAPPLRNEVVIEWGEIDDDVRALLAADGASEGISGPEVLRRDVQREMEDIGEGGAPVMVVGVDAPDGDEEIGTISAPSVHACADCSAQHLGVFFTAPQLGILLCRSCYEARQRREANLH